MKVYLDHCSTTHCDKAVVDKMIPYFTQTFGNADSQHSFGRETAKVVAEARNTIAQLLNCLPNEVYFTASGTEADNWALKGTAIARKHKDGRNKVVISAIEHHAILNSAEWLKENGYEVVHCPVTKKGIVDLEELEKIVDDNTSLVSVMYVNNEVGTIQPVEKIAEIAHKHGAYFHTDCVQAVPYLDVNVKELGADLVSISGHKFYGPKGVGALFIRNGLRIDKLVHGGGQERSRRGGTTNTPGVVGMAEAMKINAVEMQENNRHIKELRDTFVKKVLEEIPYVYFNGDLDNSVPSVANFSFEFIEGEGILMMLDLKGVAVSSGSACSSGSLDQSHVLLAMGVPVELAHGSIRFSFGKHNTMEEVLYTVDVLKQSIATLRQMSPLFKLREGEIHNV